MHMNTSGVSTSFIDGRMQSHGPCTLPRTCRSGASEARCLLRVDDDTMGEEVSWILSSLRLNENVQGALQALWA